MSRKRTRPYKYGPLEYERVKDRARDELHDGDYVESPAERELNEWERNRRQKLSGTYQGSE